MGTLLLMASLLAGQTPEKAKVDSIEPKAALELVKGGSATLVDVREADETASGMAEPAKWLPMSKLEKDPKALSEFLGKLPKGQKVIFYCAVGGRAGKVASRAAGLGYAVANMGGYESWAKAGLPTRKP